MAMAMQGHVGRGGVKREGSRGRESRALMAPR